MRKKGVQGWEWRDESNICSSQLRAMLGPSSGPNLFALLPDSVFGLEVFFVLAARFCVGVDNHVNYKLPHLRICDVAWRMVYLTRQACVPASVGLL